MVWATTANDDWREIESLLVRLRASVADICPHGASTEAIESLEKRLGRPLPSDLTRWLGLCDFLSSAGGELLSADLDVMRIDESYRIVSVHHPRDWLPIGSDGCGGYYFVSLDHRFGNGYPVFFFDVAERLEAPSFVVSSSIPKFLRFVLAAETFTEREDPPWPFDRAYVVELDPDIEHVPLTMPWEH